jgi:hypothetical protein
VRADASGKRVIEQGPQLQLSHRAMRELLPCHLRGEQQLVVIDDLAATRYARHNDRDATERAGVHHATCSSLKHHRICHPEELEQLRVRENRVIVGTRHVAAGSVLHHQPDPWVAAQPRLDPVGQPVEGQVVSAGTDEDERHAHNTTPTDREPG